jgi:hypothetical protein
MIQTAASLRPEREPVAQNSDVVLRLSEALRSEAAMVLADAVDGLTVKRIEQANVPGAGATFLSRAANGDNCNPLFRLAALFVLMKRAGMGRERALRILGWLREVIDAIWPAEDADLEEVLNEDERLDPEDDYLRHRASHGCMDSKRQLLTVKRRQVAHAHHVIMALRRRLAAG